MVLQVWGGHGGQRQGALRLERLPAGGRPATAVRRPAGGGGGPPGPLRRLLGPLAAAAGHALGAAVTAALCRGENSSARV